MTPEAIRDLLHRAPFEPFTVRLADGRAMPVPHPDFAHVLPKGRIFLVHAEVERFEIIDANLVVSLSQGLPQKESPAA